MRAWDDLFTTVGRVKQVGRGMARDALGTFAAGLRGGDVGANDAMMQTGTGPVDTVAPADAMGRVGEVPELLREPVAQSRVVGYGGAQEARMAEGRRAISPFGGRLATTADVNPMTFDATTGQARTYTADEAMGQNRNRLTNIMNRLDLSPELRRNAREQLGMLAGERQSDLGRQTAERVALFGAQGQAAEAMAGVEGKRVTADAMRDQAEAGLAGRKVAAEAGVDRTQLTVDQKDRSEAEKTRRAEAQATLQRDIQSLNIRSTAELEEMKANNSQTLERLRASLGGVEDGQTFDVGGERFVKVGNNAVSVVTQKPLFESKSAVTVMNGGGWDAGAKAGGGGSEPPMNADERGSEKRAEPAGKAAPAPAAAGSATPLKTAAELGVTGSVKPGTEVIVNGKKYRARSVK